MNANIGALDAAPAQRQQLRPQPLDDALTGVPPQGRRVARKGEALRVGAGQRASARVVQRAGRDVELVDPVREEFRGDLQALAVDLDGEIVDRRREAQRLARSQDVQRFRRGGKLQRQPALVGGRVGRGGVGGVAALVRAALRSGLRRRDCIGGAMQDVVELVVVPAAAAGGVADGEGRRGAGPQLENLLVEAGLFGELEPQDRDLAVGDGLAKFDDIALLGGPRGALQRQDVEIAR